MRINKPRIIALLFALGLSLATIGLNFVFQEILDSDTWAVVGTATFVFIISIIIYFAVVEGYFENRIKLIYKNIYRVKRAGPVRKKGIRGSLKQANEDVELWAEEFKSELEDLKEREKFRREFIGNVSHELKTPIFNIQGYLLTLLDGGLEDEEINRKYLTRASKSVDRLIDLIQDMDTLNRLESKVIDIKIQRYDLVAQAKEVMDMLEVKAKKAGVKLNLKQSGEKTLFVKADAKRIEQVLFNLLINAIKYNDKEQGEVTISFHPVGESVMVEVVDNGMGIPNADINRIFERFYRVDKSRTRGTGGRGLGLSIVKHIIDQHQQLLNVSSKDGMGSTFTFSLEKA